MAFSHLSQKFPVTQIKQLFAALVEPYASVQDKEQRRRSRLLATLMLFLLPFPLLLSIAFTVKDYANPWESSYVVGAFFSSVLMGGGYVLSRQGRYRLAIMACLGVGSLVIFAIALSSSADTASDIFYYLIVPLLFSSQFLSNRTTLILAAVYLLSILLISNYIPDFVSRDYFSDPFSFYLVSSILILIITSYAKRLENERRTELSESEARYRLLIDTANEGIFQIAADTRLTYVNPRLTEMLNYTTEELIGKSYFDFLRPDMVEESQQRFEQRRQGIKGKRDVCFRKKDGSEVWVVASASPILDDRGTFSGMISMLTDITERKQAEAAEREARQFAEALNEISATLSSTLDVDEVLQRILSNIGKVIRHDATDIMFIQQGVAELVAHRNHNEPEQEKAMLGWRFVLDEVRDLREVYETGDPLIIANVADYAGWIRLPGQEWVQAICTIPICLENVVIGFITLKSQQSGFFTPNHTMRLKAFADSAAIAIQNARLFNQVRELATTQERQRLARELHDAVNQTLFSANLIAEALPRLWERDPNLVKQQITELQKLTRGALSEMRTSLFEMRPDALTTTDLGALLGYLVDGLSGKTTITVTLQAEGDGHLPPDVQINLYRIAQEALNNIRQHARASEVLVALAQQSEQVVLTIRDNGQGFEPGNCPTDHFGLKSLRERAAAIGAALTIHSAPGQGTQIQAIWKPPYSGH